MVKRGDLNTSYFHKVANDKLRSNNISSIKHNSVDVTEQREVKNILHSISVDNRVDLEGQNLCPYKMWNWQSLEEPFSAVFSMNSDSDPIPDGFSTLFFHKLW